MNELPIPARYAVVRILGQGTGGTVFRCRDGQLDREVAVKTLAAEGLGPDARARFLREARALALPAHPNLVKVFDAGEEGDGLYIAMELVEGRSLAATLSSGPPSRSEALAWLDGILAGLAHLHAHGVLHRDLKPANVMLDEASRPRIVDFGLARVEGATQLTGADEVMGTPAYLAPEVIGPGTFTVQTDLFAVAMIGLELLTGRVLAKQAKLPNQAAFYQLMQGGAYHAVAREVLAPHGAVGQVLLEALSPDPAHRPADAVALQRAVRRAAQGLRPRPPRGEGRRFLLRASVAGLALTAGAVAIGLSTFPAAPRPTPTASVPVVSRARFDDVLDALARSVERPSPETHAALDALLARHDGPGAMRSTRAPEYAQRVSDAILPWLRDMDRVFAGFGAWYSSVAFREGLGRSLPVVVSRIDLRRLFLKEVLMTTAPADVARLRADGRRLREQGARHLQLLLSEDVDYGPLGLAADAIWNQVVEDEPLREDGAATRAFLDQALARQSESWLAPRLRAAEHRLRARWGDEVSSLKLAAARLLERVARDGARTDDLARTLTCHAVARDLARAAADQPSRAAGARDLVERLLNATPGQFPGQERLAQLDAELAKLKPLVKP